MGIRRVILLGLAVVLVGACTGGGSSTPRNWVTTSEGATIEGVTSTAGATSTPTAPEPSGADLGRIEVAATVAAAIVEIEGGLLQTDRLIVVLEPGTPSTRGDEVAAALGGSVIGTLEYLDLYQVSLTGGDEASLRAAVQQATSLPDVQLAYADELFFLFTEYVGVRTSPLNDPVYQAEKTGGGYRAIGVERAWQYLRGSGIDPWAVKVGVTDTRLWKGSGEFDDVAVTLTNQGSETAGREVGSYTDDQGWSGQWREPDGGHGTAVTSIIAADGDDGGVVGVASPLGDKLEVVYTSVLDPDTPAYSQAAPDPNDLTQYTASSGATWSIRGLEALLTQVKTGAKVINMSWGAHNVNDPALVAAYQRFFSQMATDHPDVVFVAAAGNDGDPLPDGARHFPAGFKVSNLITVGNVNNDGTTNDSSNQTSDSFEVTLAAPGHEAVRGVTSDGSIVDDTTRTGQVSRTVNGTQQTADMSSGGGTSMAAPQVTATIALMKSLDPSLTAADIKEILKTTARRSLPATDPSAADMPISPGMGSGLLATDEAVLAVINKVRADQGQPPVNGENLLAFGVLDSVAISGEPNEFLVRATVAGCRGDCTAVTITVSGDHAVSGASSQALAAPGDVDWDVTITGEYPVTIFVQRTDNGAGSLISIAPIEIAGVWSGTLTVTEIKVPEGQTLPDGTPIEPRWHSSEEILTCADEWAQVIDEATRAALDQLRSGVPVTVTFTGTVDAPGTAILSAGYEPSESIPWRFDGSSVIIEQTLEGGYTAISMTPAGTTMTGSFGSIDLASPGVETRGVISLTKAG